MNSETCTFRGTAAALHIQGQGAAILLNRALYEQGNAKRVILVGAQIGTTGKRNLDFHNPEHLDPVGENPPGAPYNLSFRADGELLTAHILQGGGNGSFQGKLNGFPECESKPCELAWVGPSRTIKVERATTASMMVAEGFLYGTGVGPSLLTLEDAKGTLSCPNRTEEVLDTRQIWTGGEQSGLSITQFSVGPNGLELVIESHSAPDRAIGMPLGGKLAIGVGSLIGVLLIVFFALRKKPAVARQASA